MTHPKEIRKRVDGDMTKLAEIEIRASGFWSKVASSWLKGSWPGLVALFGTIYLYEASWIETDTAFIIIVCAWVIASISGALTMTTGDICLNAMSKSATYLLSQYDDLANRQNDSIQALVNIVKENGLGHLIEEVETSVFEEGSSELRN